MKVIIMGCGRVGARIASMLDRQGHSVTVLDMRGSAFQLLADDFSGDTVIGTGIDEDVLRIAGIQRADAFIAVSDNDNRNIMAGQVARHIFGIEDVVMRIYDPVREDTYRRMGYATVCPTTTVSTLILNQILPRPATDDVIDTPTPVQE